jgi:hypothetical protein
MYKKSLAQKYKNSHHQEVYLYGFMNRKAIGNDMLNKYKTKPEVKF